MLRITTVGLSHDKHSDDIDESNLIDIEMASYGPTASNHSLTSTTVENVSAGVARGSQ